MDVSHSVGLARSELLFGSGLTICGQRERERERERATERGREGGREGERDREGSQARPCCPVESQDSRLKSGKTVKFSGLDQREETESRSESEPLAIRWTFEKEGHLVAGENLSGFPFRSRPNEACRFLRHTQTILSL